MEVDRPKILIIDTRIGRRETLRILLRKYYDVVAVENGTKALEYLSYHRVNIAVIDLQLPTMRGLEVLEQVKIVAPDTEVIVMTGDSTMSQYQYTFKGMNYTFKGMNLDCLSQPFDRTEVENLVRHALDRQFERKHQNRTHAEVNALTRQVSNLKAENQRLRTMLDYKPPSLKHNIAGLSIVGRISQTALRNLDVSKMLMSIINQIRTQLGYDNMALFIHHDQEPTLNHLWQSHPRENRQSTTQMKLTLNVVPSGCQLTSARQPNHWPFCPIKVGNQVVGTMHIDNRSNSEPMSDVEHRLIQILAGYITVAIECGKPCKVFEEGLPNWVYMESRPLRLQSGHCSG